MIAAPNKKQRFILRLMILIGICCMAFFTYQLLAPALRGYRPLYDLLIITFAFTAARILYEWYHYWSIKIDSNPLPEKVFTVDIFTTFCAGEPYEMIIETLHAIQAITYPHQAYLCDEADDPYLKEVCRRLGIHHVTRTDKTDAKAGNINNALKQSNGELCVILDPDHVPFSGFLDPIVGHFNDPQIGYVQIVQAYYNQHEGWIAKGAAQQTYQYYGPMMMTMNAYGTVQAIGANCTFRRTALASIGGHAPGLAEDMHTAMRLHAQGWKSVYVPAVLSRGLVPATLSAYYKQQLKWARGVFELFVTAYFELFGKFTWRQKLHYGLVPMFYLSGFVYLLNFLIPVVSLLTDVYPLRMDFSTFAVIGLPFVTAVVLIRHYVQRWVMEDQERGFHVIGGLLLIGTWWIFITGFIYTIFRKKVPYIPTPKTIAEERNLGINTPNIIVLVLSVAAIAYGLYNSWTPYTFTMAGIAGINCFFMLFMLVASQQHKIQSYQQQHQRLSALTSYVHVLKRRFWLSRRKLYSGIRSVSLLLIVLAISASVYMVNRPQKADVLPAGPDHKAILLTGIFNPPAAGNGLTNMANVTSLQQQQSIHFDLVSVYLAWGDQPQNLVPANVMDSIYRNHSTPMITWEPWQSLFHRAAGQQDEHVFANIVAGQYDAYITRVASQLRMLNRPVFLRFAHEADNPSYPWSASGGNTAEDFKAAWRYIHQQFIAQGAWNVIWVWNPWKPATMADYFPGKAYVDWMGITGLNYGRYNPGGQSYSFSQLYAPFHQFALSQDMPVMISEMGATKDGHQQTAWLRAGINSIKAHFPEVKAIVLFNSAFDKNVPDHSTAMINWQQDSLGSIAALTVTHHLPIAPMAADPRTADPNTTKTFTLAARGVTYQKGQNWYGNDYPVTRQIISGDFKAMRKAGINTVKIYGPGVYDRITFQAARETGLSVFYSFWVPDAAAQVADSDVLPRLARQILATVARLKGNGSIQCWNIGNCTLQQMNDRYLQPELFYRRQAYMEWLKTLIAQIKKTDPSRPVTVDVNVAHDLQNIVATLRDQVPGIDAYGLVLKDNLEDTAEIHHLPVPYYFSSVDPLLYFKLHDPAATAVMENWQDQQTNAGVTFNGLKDIWGRNKPGFYAITHNWMNDTTRYHLPDIKILRPALTTMPGNVLPYHALVYQDGRWRLATTPSTGLQFEWYQVRTDAWGTPLEIKRLSKGPSLDYTVPEKPQQYRLYLVGVKGNAITSATSILNIPLDTAALPDRPAAAVR
ncbi:cellulose synthase [Chitinophaga parva]|uniref:Cellulose synthase n=1 Tax=Chitinophaga parva TaxID=2169414 RepID=A0A2T7BC31_9BACT|nr:glycosyltransferase family 2 protein [Chitinophaga parva]PUZ22590.1 cellulose synthase [Chitinophaga parva]